MPEPFQTWLSEWSQRWAIPRLSEKVQIRYSSRLKRSLGRCNLQSGQIRLHTALHNNPNGLLKEALCHETAHVASNILFGTSVRPHGPEWAQLMVTAGFEPRVRIEGAILPKEIQAQARSQNLYEHFCPICGVRRFARRVVRRWRCRQCLESGLNGHLVINKKSVVEVESH